MKAVLFIALAIWASCVASVPAPGGAYAGMPPEVAAFIPPIARAFIPTPEEIAALKALDTTPAPGATPPSGPMAPPTMPAAVAHLVQKYKAAAQAAALAAAALPPTPIV
ncbi:DNA translocase FtsK 1-like [Palaemon carinicauda]|uniref:DNA translocase FtsK 1-like n=1 Tax=Palaemon carinicauda TaxID=392227 RepID=UPI0035B5C90E